MAMAPHHDERGVSLWWRPALPEAGTGDAVDASSLALHRVQSSRRAGAPHGTPRNGGAGYVWQPWRWRLQRHGLRVCSPWTPSSSPW
jgi:hypothetical protein